LPAQAVGLVLADHVEHREVVAQLLARALRVEVPGIAFTPVEGDAAILDEGEGVVDALVGDAPAGGVSP
jgi:hypothetical protein